MNLLSVIADRGFRPISATGGAVSVIDDAGTTWRVHTFTSSGSFVVSDLGDEGKIEYLVVGGGGSGGYARGGGSGSQWSVGGGGGAGGVLTNVGGNRVAVTVGTIAVVVGAGGSGAFRDGGGSSRISLASPIQASGGGIGGEASIIATYPSGLSGASSGGAAALDGGPARTSLDITAQNDDGLGNRGGNNTVSTPNVLGGTGSSGGGGGAGSAGLSDGTAGSGVVNTITGASVTYAQGGSGKTSSSPNGAGANATIIGGGGDGAARIDPAVSNYNGGSGAAGIVVIRYPLSQL